MLTRCLLTVALVAGASMAPATTVAAQAEGGVGIRLVDAPVDRRDDPRAQVNIVDHLPPGATIRRRVEVTNTTRQVLAIRLYATGAEIVDGAFRGYDGEQGNELSSWIRVEPAVVELGAGEAAFATLTIGVSGDAPAGEQYGVVWAQPPAAASPGGITVVNRVGIRVYLSVGPGGEPVSDFVVDSLTAMRDDAGRPVVAARVENTGGRALDLSGELSLRDGPGGLRAGPFPAELGTTLAPGDTAPVIVVLDPALPAGPWEAELLLRSGRLERLATATIAFPDGRGEVGAPAPAITTDVEAQRRWLLLFALGLLLLALLLLALATRRQKPRPQPRVV